MLCFFCITEDRSEPNKYVTFVEGTAVCREHAVEIPPPAKQDAPSPDAAALVQKLKEFAERVKQQRTAPTNGALNGALSADAFIVDAD